MGLIDTIFGKGKKNEGLTKKQIEILKLPRNLRQMLTTISFHFPKEKEKLEKLSEENKAEILPLIRDYNYHLRAALPVITHLDKKLGDEMKDLYLQENTAYLSINQNSKQSTYTRIEVLHDKLHSLIQEVKKRYIFENTSQQTTASQPEDEVAKMRAKKAQLNKEEKEYKKAA